MEGSINDKSGKFSGNERIKPKTWKHSKRKHLREERVESKGFLPAVMNQICLMVTKA